MYCLLSLVTIRGQGFILSVIISQNATQNMVELLYNGEAVFFWHRIFIYSSILNEAIFSDFKTATHNFEYWINSCEGAEKSICLS